MEKKDEVRRVIGAHGGYRKLRSFQVATIIYDGTVIFCNRFVERNSRTRDQMIQAARSGKQNIAEGSMASATSKKTELNLTSVAKSSLEELCQDYEDFLRQRGLRIWNKDCAEAVAVRSKYRSELPDTVDPYGIATATAEAAANTLICLINQATFLLGRQIRRQEATFLRDGGFSERLYQARKQARRGCESPSSD